MANQTVTSDTDMESVIALGLLDGENITINSGAKLTVTQTPSKLIGDITVNDGTLFIDGLNISSGNVINFVGENGEDLVINGLGTLDVDGDWYSIGTTDGTNSQSVTVGGASSYFGSTLIDVIPAIWVETGRRIDFDGSSGTAPEVDDYVRKTSDHSIFGRIVEVQSTYLVVKWLIGSLADDDAIEVCKVVDNLGPDLQISWTANVNNASGDIKESGVYQAFGNARANATSCIGNYGHGAGGFLFEHAHGATTLTMGSAIGGGFVPPSGCNIRVPNVHFSTSDLTAYALGNTAHQGATEGNWHNLNTGGAGECNFSTCNIGTAFYECTSAAVFTAEYVGATVQFGSLKCGSRATYNECVLVSDPENTAYNFSPSFGGDDSVSGYEADNCLLVKSACSRNYLIGSNSDGTIVKNTIVTASLTITATTSPDYGAVRFSGTSNCQLLNCIIYWSDASATSAEIVVGVAGARNSTIKNLKLSATQDETQAAGEDNLMYFSGGCSGTWIENFEVLGSGHTGGAYIRYRDCSDLTMRACGMIDDKIDRGTTDAEHVVIMEGKVSGVDLARCWFDNGVNPELFSMSNVASNVTIQNCSGKYAAEVELDGGNAIDVRGLHGGSGSINSSTGVEVDLSAVYGSHWHDIFRSDTTGMIFLLFTPKTTQTTSVYSVLSGSPKFDKGGAMNLANGDSIEFEMQYFALGHTGFTGSVTLGKGAVTDGNDEWGSNVAVTFQYDTGAGYNGSWLDLKTSSNLTGIADTTDGVKIKVKITASADVTGLDSLAIHTTTTLADQTANLYPIDQDEVTVTVTCTTESGTPIQYAHVLLHEDGDPSTVIMNGATDVNGEISETLVYTADINVVGWVRQWDLSGDDYTPKDIAGTITNNGLSLLVKLQPI